MPSKKSEVEVRATVSGVLVQPPRAADPLPDPCGFAIFGASGDLTKRKLIPALFHLMQGGVLPAGWYLLGLARTKMSDEEFRRAAKEALDEFVGAHAVTPADWEAFRHRLYYLAGEYLDPGYYRRLSRRLLQLDAQHGVAGNRLFYLATPPNLYAGIVRKLGEAGLHQLSSDTRWSRVVIEKPFGADLDSAQALNREVRQVFGEDTVYRIDHYLGKETIQNILFFRFANAIYEPIWDGRSIDHVQITVAESLGVEHRAGYYEQTGALRDMFQNHLLHLLCLVAMEPPARFDPDTVRDERVKVLKAVRVIRPDDVAGCAVRGQYRSGVVDGQPVAGYRGESGVAPDSTIETYAALKLYVDNWRWRGVPFYLRSGKRLAKRSAEIAVEFKPVPHRLFTPALSAKIHPNTLVFSIQPHEGISLTLQAKPPGPRLSMGTVTMDFDYHSAFKTPSSDAYQQLLLDCMTGDQMLFAREDWLTLSWSLLAPILEDWTARPAADFPNYEAGSHGPTQADELMEHDGRRWRPL